MVFGPIDRVHLDMGFQSMLIDSGESPRKLRPMPKQLADNRVQYAQDELIPIQPLRVTEGWCVDYNRALYEIDVDPELLHPGDYWHIFKEDMLSLTHSRNNRLIDVGFYPEGDLEKGNYGLVLYEGDHTGRLIAELNTRDRAQLVTTIEDWMQKVTLGRL